MREPGLSSHRPPGPETARDGHALSVETERELRRKTFWLILAFLIIHFAMLTARSSVLALEHQPEMARARAILVPCSGALMLLMYAILRHWIGRPFLRQAALGAMLSTAAAILHAAAWARFLNGLDADKYPSPLAYVAYESFYWYLYYFAWTTAYLALSYSITVREQERHSSALRAEAQDAQIRAMRYQINPHFLFNTLNAIAGLIAEDRAQAEAMVVNLSGFFRASLAFDPTEDVRLADEIALQMLYLDIERVRFPDRIAVSVALPEPLRDALVPSLLLQPLIENAVKHGVARSEGRTNIRIQASATEGRLRLSVADDAVKARPPALRRDGTGVGLENVRNRLRLRFDEQCLLETVADGQAGFHVEMEVPLQFPAHR